MRVHVDMLLRHAMGKRGTDCMLAEAKDVKSMRASVMANDTATVTVIVLTALGYGVACLWCVAINKGI